MSECHSKVYKAYATQHLLVQLILFIDTSSHRTSPVVEEIIVRQTIAGPEFLLLEEEGIVHQ